MNNKSLDWQILRYMGYAALFLGGAYLLYLVRGTLPLFFVALLLAYALEPLLQRLEGRGYSRRAAVGFVFLIFVLLLLCLGLLLAMAWQQVQALSENFPELLEKIKAIAASLRGRVDAVQLPGSMKDSVLESLSEAQKNHAMNRAREQADNTQQIGKSARSRAVLRISENVTTP